jgi:branched-chain amino acid transport system permease protein
VTFARAPWAPKAARAAVLAALVAAPFLLSEFRLGLLTDILIFGLWVVSLDLLIGYAGLVSLGHAAFFGLGAYTVALLATEEVTTSVLLTLPAAVLLAGLAAVVLGWLATATRGVAFIMLTLALGEILFVLAATWKSVTRGDDGLPLAGDLMLLPGFGIEFFESDFGFYFYVLALFLLGLLLVKLIVNSPFGLVLEGIRENPERMASLGYWVKGYKLAAFTIAGALAGLAGALHAQKFQFVSPELLGFTLSALALVMHTIGGGRSLYGPVLGAGVVLFVRDELSATFEHWLLLLGIVFILFVYFLPRGIAGLIDRRPRTAARLPAAGGKGGPAPASLVGPRSESPAEESRR